MDVSMTTTTFDLDGYKVTRGLGVVRGITARSRPWPAATSPSSPSCAKRPAARPSR
jgi:hypothetical protein